MIQYNAMHLSARYSHHSNSTEKASEANTDAVNNTFPVEELQETLVDRQITNHWLKWPRQLGIRKKCVVLGWLFVMSRGCSRERQRENDKGRKGTCWHLQVPSAIAPTFGRDQRRSSFAKWRDLLHSVLFGAITEIGNIHVDTEWFEWRSTRLKGSWNVTPLFWLCNYNSPRWTKSQVLVSQVKPKSTCLHGFPGDALCPN